MRLKAEEGQLRIRAPKGAVDDVLRSRLAARKAELIAYLERDAAPDDTLPQAVPDPENRHAPFPLTDIQEAYWIGSSAGLESGGGYHYYLEFEVPDLDVPRLERAWQALIARHEMLRAVVLADGTQRILDEVPDYRIRVQNLAREGDPSPDQGEGGPAKRGRERVRGERAPRFSPPPRGEGLEVGDGRGGTAMPSRHDRTRAGDGSEPRPAPPPTPDPSPRGGGESIATFPIRRGESPLAVRHRLSHRSAPLDRWPLSEVEVSLLPGGGIVHVSLGLIVLDSGSMMILFEEWERLYREPGAALPPLPSSFRDYVTAERALSQTPLYKRAERYWQDRLADLPPAPDLPLAPSAAPVESRFERLTGRLDAASWSALKERAVRLGLTPSAALLAAFSEILATWSASPRFTLNLTLFNRLPLAEGVERMVGDFTSVTLLAVDFRERRPFTEHAACVNRQLRDDLDHRAYPGVRALRDWARLQGSTGRALAPVVFSSTLVLDIAPAFSLHNLFGGRLAYAISQTPQCDLDHQLMEDEGALVFHWDVAQGVYPEGMVEAMFAAYRALLERLAQSDEGFSETRSPWIPPEQRARHAAMNDTAAPIPDATLAGLFRARAAERPDAPALIAPGFTLSYREFQARAEGVAQWLREGGLGREEIVAIRMEKGWEQVVAVLGTWMAGGAYLPIDPALPPQRQAHLLNEGEVRFGLTQGALAEPGSDVTWLSVDAHPPPPSEGEGEPAEGRQGEGEVRPHSHSPHLSVAEEGEPGGRTPSPVQGEGGPAKRGREKVRAAGLDAPALGNEEEIAVVPAHPLPTPADAGSTLSLDGRGGGQKECGPTAPSPCLPPAGCPSPSEGGGKSALAYVLYTSGSTGLPKGVMVEERSVVNRMLDVVRRFGITHEDRAIALTALHHDLSVFDIAGVLCCAGGALVMPEAEKLREPAHWHEIVRAHGVTIWNSVPAFMGMLAEHLDEAGGEAPALRLCILSGDFIPVTLPDRIRRLMPGLAVVSAGGPTETTVWDICHPVGAVDMSRPSIPYGRPMANARYFVLKDNLDPCPDWTTGELCIGGIGLARGYRRDEAANAAKFVVHPETGERLYRSGDFGRRRPDGTIEILGRTDFQVKIHGQRIELGEIEAALERIPGVERAVVIVAGEAPERRRLVAHVQMAQDAAPAPDSALDAMEFKLSQPGLRRARAGEIPVLLPEPKVERAAFIARQSHRRFTGEAVPASSLAALLAALRQTDVAGAPLAKRLYPSAGSLYPVQVYLHVRAGAVEGVAAGFHSYDPQAHALVALGGDADGLYGGTNRTLLESGAFALFLVGALDAVEPLYPGAGRDFCLLEAGHIGQVLMERAGPALIGLCPLGNGVDEERLRTALGLTARHVLVYSLAGGRIEAAWRERWMEYEGPTRAPSPPREEGPGIGDGAKRGEPAERTPSPLRGGGWPREAGSGEGCWGSTASSRTEHGGRENLSTEVPASALESSAPAPLSRPPLTRGPPSPAEGGGFSRHRLAFSGMTALRKALAQTLPPHMIPAAFVRWDALPLTANGKIDRRRLVEAEPDSAPSLTTPATAIEMQLASILAGLLGAESVSPRTPFFELGATSVTLVQFRNRLREAFGREVPMAEIFARSSVRLLAGLFEDAPEAPSAALADAVARAARQQAFR